ncbi:MAG: Hsp33 family molecular chaperone HslO [Pseudomonadota bacterium]
MDAPSPPADDLVANFQIDSKPVRGRITRLADGSLDPILKRHDYPDSLARILGEAVSLAVLVGSSLKFEGRLIVQAEGDGPISMLVGEYHTDGGVRGYARFDAERWARLDALNKGGRPHMPQLFGRGALALIIVQDNKNAPPYQGVVPLEKATLAECAEDYFNQSQQVPTRVALSVAELHVTGEAPVWRAGGILLQKLAGDEARGETDDAWETAEALFSTVSDGELADPDLRADRLLYRLFHEEGVRMEAPSQVRDACTCSEERYRATLASMPDEQLRDLAEADGALATECQFCGRTYRIPLADVTG